MPKLTGVLLQFNDLDNIPIAEVTQKIKPSIDIRIVENFFGNRIIYPQTIPVTQEDMEIDLAILGQAIKLEPEMILNTSKNTLTIEENLIKRFMPLQRLIEVIVENTKLPKVTPVFIKRSNLTTLSGTVIKPGLKLEKGQKVEIGVNNQILNLKSGSFTVLPFGDHHLIIKIGSDIPFSVSGGELGLIIDLRVQN